MSYIFNEKSRFFVPPYHEIERDNHVLLIDPEHPHWVGTDGRGAGIIRLLDGKRNLADIVAAYRRDADIDWAKGWLHCQTLMGDALRAGFISTAPFPRAPYPGRAEALQMERLSELWLHVTNACNLSCIHCLVNSSPTGIPGAGTDFWKRVIDQAVSLGTDRFFITGGEPFLRDDIFQLIDAILPHAELVILTNAMRLQGERLKRLAQYDPERLKLQISLDGPTAEVNDPIRGKGSFDLTVRGMKEVIGIGFSPTLTTVVTQANVAVLPEMVYLAERLGVRNMHLLLSHRRGRAAESEQMASPPDQILLQAFLEVRRLTYASGIAFDNIDTLEGKLLGRPGVKFDLTNMAYTSLCVYADGQVYPSAALAGIPSLEMGSLMERPLSDIWNAPIADTIRRGTVQRKARCKDCYLKYLCGGGDPEQTYHNSGHFIGEDPFSQFHEALILETLFSVIEARAKRKTASGFDRPIVFAAMGDMAIEDTDGHGVSLRGGFEVSLSRSACVLSVDLDKSRRYVRDFYGGAAKSPKPQLCCVGGYSPQETSHIPKSVMEIAYGCGSPIAMAGIQKGEVVVDLGAGGGIDCFVAALQVGSAGRVIGIDMTDEMLLAANRAKKRVAENLGYDIVEFKKGYLEEIPLPSQFADLITSNCVINLSVDKNKVFVEAWRVLKDFGRIVISDTVSERPIPVGMKANPRLWGECVSGALTEEAYLAQLERAGFYGLSVIKKDFWKEVEGYRFYSIILRGYKFEKKAGCSYIGQQAIYLGPMQGVVDEEGHFFPRNRAIDVCTDTAEKLTHPPYSGSFVIVEGEKKSFEMKTPVVSTEEACCPPGKCC